MASSGTSPPQSLINAAVQSLLLGAGAVGTLGVVGALGSIGALGIGAAVAGPGVGIFSSTPLSLVQLYFSWLVPSVSITGQSIPKQRLSGPLAVDTNCLAPEFNYDFANICDNGVTFRRGGQRYERPCGSYRLALKVKDKFGTDNDWLGKEGDHSDEWPVSYHGTAAHNALNIAEEGFRLSKGKRFKFGRGIYSTPELAVAKLYASNFAYEGTSYQCIIQNRVNPKYLEVIPTSETNVGIYWLSATEQYVDETEVIRPYGLCLFKV